MKILYVYGMAKTKDIVYNLRKLGYDVEEYHRELENSILNDEEIELLTTYVKEHHITHLMSIHLIYILALVAYNNNIKYVSIIWDAPYIKMYTPFGRMDNCYFSVFDKVDYDRFRADGIPHVFYQPLAVNQDEVRRWNVKRKLKGKYWNEITFVGSLYDDNLYDKKLKGLPKVLQDYFYSIFEEAAFHWDGVNRVYGKTDKVILDYIKIAVPDFKVENNLDIDDVRFFEVLYLIRKIANIERVCILNALCEEFPVTFHTNSTTDTSVVPHVKRMPPVLPGEAIATVYAGSKVNLNISLKGIEGGTPQRIMDIMSAGGFALTNYCSETAELFEEDKEIVMFKTPEELLEKAGYYLAHDEERKRIAKAGYEKVMSCYTYEKKLKQLMDWVEEC